MGFAPSGTEKRKGLFSLGERRERNLTVLTCSCFFFPTKTDNSQVALTSHNTKVETSGLIYFDEERHTLFKITQLVSYIVILDAER